MKSKSTENDLALHRNLLAAELSAVPGVGHFYKGHYWLGSGFAFAGFALAIWVISLISLTYAVGAIAVNLGVSVRWLPLLLNPVTLWVGLVPALLLWLAAALDAFEEPDLRQRPERRGNHSPKSRSSALPSPELSREAPALRSVLPAK